MAQLKRVLTVALLLTCGGQALAADPAALEQLVQQAQFLESRNRPDLAREAWLRVLATDADNVTALEHLVDLEARNGSPADAAKYETRLRALAPDSPALQRRAAGAPAISQRDTMLSQARELARKGDADAAVAAYKPLLDANGQPPDDVALEYYETLAGSRGGWEAARDGLRKGTADRPDDPRYALAYARVLTYRGNTRREGIQALDALAESTPALRAEARAAQRNALVWLQASEADRPLYERYLAAAGEDRELADKLENLSSQQKAQAQARADASRAARLRAGYDALEANDIAGAERFFEARLQQDRSDADALAGLGLVRLRQQRFAEADAALSQAVAAKPALRKDFASALNSSRYWHRVVDARNAQQRGQWRAAAQAYESALAVQPAADPDVRRDYAAALRQLGDVAKAERVLRDGLAREPDSAPLIGELAELLLAQQRDGELDLLLSKSRQSSAPLRKVQTELLRARAANAVAAGQGAQAEGYLQQALAAAPEDPWIRLDLARLYRSMGRSVDADNLLESLGSGDPQANPDATLAQAYALAEAQRWYETLIVLERVPAERRDAASVRLQRSSWIQYELQRATQAAAIGESVQAVEFLNGAIAAAGEDPEYASAIAQGWTAMGDPARAVAALRKAFAQKAPAPGASIQYAALLLQLGQDAEFEAVTTALIRANTMSAAQHGALEDLIVGYRIKLADRLREQGDLAAAYAQLREVVMRYPNQPRVQMALSRLFISAGDTDKALAIANAMRRSHPLDAEVRLSAIEAALAAGDRDAADQWIAEARAEGADDPAIDRAAARLADQRGNRAESLRLLRRAADLEDRERRDSVMPVLVLIDPRTQGEVHLPDPVRELLDDNAESVGPLLPRAGDAGPAPGGAAASRFGGFRLDPAVGNKATGAPMAKSAGSAGDGVQLRLDTASPRLAAARPSEAEQLQRLEAGLAPWVAGSFATRSRQGEAGLSRLLAIETPIDLASREFEAGRLGVRARPVILDSGTPSGRNTLRFGTGALVNGEIDDDEQSANGIAFALDYNIGELSLDVGTTPLGFDVESFVGGLRWLTRPTGALQLTGELSRRAVTDSLLSYAGTTDRLTGVRWGGVVRTGGRVDIAYDLERYGLYASGAYYGLGGRNVDENSMLEFGGGLFFRVLQSRRGGDVTVGLNLTSFGYDRNLRHFTFGHGGYFSPQFFTAVTVPLSWTGRRGRLDYRVDAALGLQTFREDGAPLYPGFPALQDELEEIVEFEPTNDIPLGYESQKVSGLGYKFGATMEYRFNERMSAGGLVSLDNARDYEETVVHFYVRYHFSDRDGTRGAFSTPDLQRGALP